MNTDAHQYEDLRLPPLAKPQREGTRLRAVRQDKDAPTRVRIATNQPVVPKNTAHTRQLNTLSPRSQNPSQKRSSKRQTVQISGWGRPQLKRELERIAEQEGLSLSQTVIAALEEWVRQQLHIQHTVLIQPIIETTIRNELRRYFSRMILFLARITMTLDVMKGLVKWLCRRIAGATKQQVDTVEAVSRKDARLNLVKRTPQLESITEELEQTLMEGIV